MGVRSRLLISAIAVLSCVAMPLRESSSQQVPNGNQAEGRSQPFSGEFFQQGLFPRSPDSTGRRWQLESRRPRHWISSISWHPEGRLLAVGEKGGIVRIYEPDSWRLVNLWYCDGIVEEVAYSPDGKHLAATITDAKKYGSGRTLHIWTADGAAVATTSTSIGMVSNIAWSPDGDRLATVGHYRKVFVYDLEGKQRRVLEGHESTIHRVAWSPQGNDIASASDDGELRIWHLSRAVPKPRPGGRAPIPVPPVDEADLSVPSTVVEGQTPFAGLCWMPDGKTLVCVDASGRISQRSAEGKLVKEFRSAANRLGDIALHHDGDRLAVGGNGAVELHHIANQSRRILLPDESAHRLQWNPRNDLLAMTDGQNVVMLDLKSEKKSTLAGTSSSSSIARPIVWSPDGTSFTFASQTPWLRIWNADGSGVARNWKLPGRTLWHVDWSSDNRWLATEGFVDQVRYWKPDGTPGPVFDNLRVGNRNIGWSPNGKLFAIAGTIGTVHLADAEGKIAALYENKEERGHMFRWSPRSDRLAIVASSVPSQVKVLDTEGKVTATMDGKVEWVFGLDWHPTARQLALTDRHGNVYDWNTDGAQGRILGGHGSQGGAVAWSPDGRWLASSSSDIKVWNGEGKLLTNIHPDAHAIIRRLAWHPQSTWLAGQIFHRSVRLWKPTGEAGPTLYGGNALADGSAAWSPDGRRIVCATSDEGVIVWDAETGTPRWVGVAMQDGKSAVVDADGELHVAEKDLEAFDDRYVFVERVDGKIVLKTAAEWRKQQER